MKKPAAYVENRSRLDPVSRRKKYRKLKLILEDFVQLKNCDVLDVGTSSGYIQRLLAKHTKSLTSVDIIDERQVKEGYKFIKVSSTNLPFKDGSFDVAISSHVVEHVPGQKKHIKELARVLKGGGVAYLATPSKYAVVEPHYKLPFLSWLPRPLATIYLDSFKRIKWNIYPVSRAYLKHLVTNDFEIIDMVPRLLKYNQRYHLGAGSKASQFFSRLPLPLLKLASPLSPTIVCVLKRR